MKNPLLPEITAKPKTGEETLTLNGNNTNYSLLDFWRWSVSDLISNATRGRFAEFVVGSAIDIDPTDLRDEWDAFDLTSKEGIKIEVKSAAYIQSWEQKKYSAITFSIKKSKLWNEDSTKRIGELVRHADVYVFCLLKNKDQDTIDPLKMEQWEFYVVPTITLDNYERSEHSISLKSLKKLVIPIQYQELKEEINNAYKQQLL